MMWRKKAEPAPRQRNRDVKPKEDAANDRPAMRATGWKSATFLAPRRDGHRDVHRHQAALVRQCALSRCSGEGCRLAVTPGDDCSDGRFPRASARH